MEENEGLGLDKCEECGKPLCLGEAITHVIGEDRFWHLECFNQSLTPIKDWPKSEKK